MNILVTGGAGYIGSHTCVELLQAGHEVIIVDNLSNSKSMAIERIQELGTRPVYFYKTDLLDSAHIESIFTEHKIDAVIHFAGLKAVGESVSMPLKYYHNNITGALILCELMAKYGVKKLVFSSSATVYGLSNKLPLTEDMPLSATNPYGQTKLMIEQVLQDLYVSDPAWSIVLLRYFNPIGAHHSGRIGEDPGNIPNNLMPYITQVATGSRTHLNVFGNDYNTRDGTGVRDYIHVVDLAKGHLQALNATVEAGIEAYNLGTGTGYSVLEVISAFEMVTGKKVPYIITPRRPGDIDTCFANPVKALERLGWKATKTLHDMCRDAWNWQKNNPKGYV